MIHFESSHALRAGSADVSVRHAPHRHDAFVNKNLIISRFALSADETSVPSEMRLPDSEAALLLSRKITLDENSRSLLLYRRTIYPRLIYAL